MQAAGPFKVLISNNCATGDWHHHHQQWSIRQLLPRHPRRPARTDQGSALSHSPWIRRAPPPPLGVPLQGLYRSSLPQLPPAGINLLVCTLRKGKRGLRLDYVIVLPSCTEWGTVQSLRWVRRQGYCSWPWVQKPAAEAEARLYLLQGAVLACLPCKLFL